MVVIRRAQDEDTQAIFEVHTRAILEVCATRYSASHVEAWVNRLPSGSHLWAIRSREFLVAVEDSRIVGFGQLDRDTGEIEAIYVHPHSLRQGIGSLLLRALEKAARAAGLSSLCKSSAKVRHIGCKIKRPFTPKLIRRV
jgi:GNAT superfamily N-acetyltransferase